MSGRPTHLLEAWTRRTFGEVFAQFVLHGLLNDAETRTGRIKLEGADRNGQKWRKTIAFAKPRAEAWGLKPLVLAALLKQLVGRPIIERELGYTFKALLAELMWPDVPANWRVVKDALGSYHGCVYSSDGVRDDGTKRHAVRGHYTLLTRLDFCGVDTSGRDRYSDLSQTVEFDLDIIEGLRWGKVIFAGTDFGELSIGPATPGAGDGAGPRGAAQTAAPPPECPLRPPGPRPALLFDVTPLSLGPRDPWSKVWARAVGETTVSIDTGAKANAVLRLVRRVVARHPPEHACPPEWFGAVAEYVCRETDRRFREGVRSLAKTVPLGILEDVIVQGRGVIHSLPVEVSQARPGPRPVWSSADHLVGSLERAIKAIEFDGEWKPPKWVRRNRRWRPDEVKAATVKVVAAYWKDKEKMKLGEVDPSKMGKWLRAFGLPKFTELRSLLRQRITTRMAILDAFESCRDTPYLLALNLLSLTNS